MKKNIYSLWCAFFLMLISSLMVTSLQAQVNQKELTSFIRRIIPGHASSFIIQAIPRENNKDAFELASKDGKIILRGSNGLSVASALHYYLKNYCFCELSWNGQPPELPKVLPMVEKTVHKNTPYKYRYYLNYCTFNYSMSWWDWDRWQKEIDWMALNGINLPLALTGEEAVWQHVYRKMGFADKELDLFFSGPAYFSWFWMGNLDAWGGPLPQHWMDTHKALQKKILARERSFGMTPVLSAFTGHVPPTFKDRFPNAKVKKTNWGAGFADVYILDPEDPLFEEIGKQYIQEQTREFGTDHFYSADTFNENVPPTDDSLYLSDMSQRVYQSMAAADPKAIWVMQGWMFHYNSKFWKTQQIKALLNAVPDDHMIILDLYSEAHPEWQRTEAYYGKPWIWCMLQNFGGNISLFGPMKRIAADPASALHDPNSGKLSGIGMTPEGIEQNPALFALMLENVWRDQPIDLDAWLTDYAHRRYGENNELMRKAWPLLLKSVYAQGHSEGGPESIIVARPTLEKSDPRVNTKLEYDPRDLIHAWQYFIQAGHQLHNSDGFKYDVVDVTRQVLANYASILQEQLVKAYQQKDQAAFSRNCRQFLQLMDDVDNLLSTRKDFLLGKWLANARANGITDKEKNLYEFNARDLITLWGDKESELTEYSNRQWAGLIKGYYKPRWQMFFAVLAHDLKTGTDFDAKAFDIKIKNWEWQWVNQHGNPYAATPSGNSVKVAKELYEKYAKPIERAYSSLL